MYHIFEQDKATMWARCGHFVFQM